LEEFENSEKKRYQCQQKKGRYIYVDGRWFWVGQDFELVYKKIKMNGKSVPFPFGFKRKITEACAIN